MEINGEKGEKQRVAWRDRQRDKDIRVTGIKNKI